MDFNDTSTEARFRKKARAWLDANAPSDFKCKDYNFNHDLRPFKDWQRKKAAAGWTCFTWPEEFGGRGGTAIDHVIWSQEEAGLSHLSTPFIIGLGMGGATLMTHGSAELQQRYLGPMVTGEEIWCQLFTEPAAGSDLAGIRTRAVRDGDDWVVNGQKIWTSYAHLADFGILIARTDPTVAKHKGLTYFIMDMKAAGVEVRPIKMVSGESDFNEVFMTDVRIPDSHRVGAIGQGWKVALTTLMNERLTVGTTYPTYFDEILDLACEIKDENGPMIEEADVRNWLADWFTQSNGIKYTGFRMISAVSRGQTPGPETLISKLVLGRGRQEIGWHALDLLDEAGIIVDEVASPLATALQKIYFTSIGDRIAGGTDEIMLNIIGERVLGLPPEPRVDKNMPFNEIPTGKSSKT